MSENVEITKAQLDTFQRGMALLDKLWPDMDFKRMVKAKQPDIQIPELDIVDQATKPVNEKMAALEADNKKLREDWEADRKSRQDERAMIDFRSELTAAQKKFGLTDEGLQKVVDRMKDKNNPDVEAAAAYVLSQQPKPEPVAPSGLAPESFNLYGVQEKDDNWSELHKNPIKWFDKQAAAILAEPQDA